MANGYSCSSCHGDMRYPQCGYRDCMEWAKNQKARSVPKSLLDSEQGPLPSIPLKHLERAEWERQEAIRVFTQARWPDDVLCPYCQSGAIKRVGAPLPYRCRDCRKYFSVLVGTFAHRSHIPEDLLLKAICLYIADRHISSMQLHRELMVTQDTAWHLRKKIRKAMEWSPDDARLIRSIAAISGCSDVEA